MGKKLVAYFSASGVTASLARTMAEAVGADLHEIMPEVRYTEADLNWRDENSRSTVEMKNRDMRPAVANRVEHMEEYDTIFVGFPIWWYVAPTIVNTFLEQYDLSGKKIVTFATSGGSGIGNANTELAPSCSGAVVMGGMVFPAGTTADELKKWADGLECL